MDIKDIDKKLIQEIEEYHKEAEIDMIHANSSTDLIISEYPIYFIFLIHNGYKQKIGFDIGFIENNSYNDVVREMKNKIRESAEIIKKVADKV